MEDDSLSVSPAGPVTDTERRYARLMDQDCGRTESIAIRAVRRSIIEGQASVVSAFTSGRDIGAAAAAVLQSFRRDLASSMLLSSVSAIDRVRMETSRQIAMAWELASVGDTFRHAMAFLLGRNRLTDKQLDEISSRADANVVRVLATANAQAQKRLGQAVAEVYAKNLPVPEGVELVKQTWESLGLAPSNPFQIEGIVRTQIALAYGAGVRAAAKRPEIDEILWGWKYVTVGDNRVRPTHRAMDGVTLPKDDPFWRENSCPNGFCCRCKQIMVFSLTSQVSAPDSVSVGGVDVPVRADDGFRFDPGELIPSLAA